MLFNASGALNEVESGWRFGFGHLRTFSISDQASFLCCITVCIYSAQYEPLGSPSRRLTASEVPRADSRRLLATHDGCSKHIRNGVFGLPHRTSCVASCGGCGRDFISGQDACELLSHRIQLSTRSMKLINPQLIGRDLYLPLEPVLIYIPLALHLLSSTLKRAFLTYRTRRRPPMTIHLITGWLLVPFVLPHIVTHRLLPQSPHPPISSLSPSELNFEFVSYALYSRPLLSTVAYLGLVGLAVPHAVLGSMKIVSWIRRLRAGDRTEAVRETPRRTDIPRKRKRTALYALNALLGVVAIGLGRLYSEGEHVGPFMAKRYEAIFRTIEPGWMAGSRMI